MQTQDTVRFGTAATVAARAADTVQWLLTGTASGARDLDNMASNDASNMGRTTLNPQTDNDAWLLGKLEIQPDAAQKHVLTLEYVQRNSPNKRARKEKQINKVYLIFM